MTFAVICDIFVTACETSSDIVHIVTDLLAGKVMRSVVSFCLPFSALAFELTDLWP